MYQVWRLLLLKVDIKPEIRPLHCMNNMDEIPTFHYKSDMIDPF